VVGQAEHPASPAYPNGRFAQLADPEGNVVQLWQPA
jgi:predicted enzyme related to lactoylglutathione lyase